MGVVELTKANFDKEVMEAKVPVVIDFWATWCGPCQMQSPIVDAVAEEMGDKVKICKVNVDEQPELAMNYQIASIPTLVFMLYGLFKTRVIGLQDADTIKDYLNTILDEQYLNQYNEDSCKATVLFVSIRTYFPFFIF